MLRQLYCSIILLLMVCISLPLSAGENNRYLTYTVNPAKQNIALFWKDHKGNTFNSIINLKNYIEERQGKLLFAMNGGMYMEDYRPLGLYIENGVQKKAINKANGYGNFYLKPNGIFFITNKNTAGVCETNKFINKDIKYATQSGPLLVINGAIHPSFTKGSKNLQIRNGVGILPDGKVLFVMSKVPVSLYDFADYFKTSGCKYALFLDGFVCRTYLPEKNWMQTDGDFGVIIGSIEYK